MNPGQKSRFVSVMTLLVIVLSTSAGVYFAKTSCATDQPKRHLTTTKDSLLVEKALLEAQIWSLKDSYNAACIQNIEVKGGVLDKHLLSTEDFICQLKEIKFRYAAENKTLPMLREEIIELQHLKQVLTQAIRVLQLSNETLENGTDRFNMNVPHGQHVLKEISNPKTDTDESEGSNENPPSSSPPF